MVGGTDSGERVFEMLRRGGGRSALAADDDLGLLAAAIRVLVDDLLAAVAVDEATRAVHLEAADPGAVGAMLAFAVADDLEPADPVALAFRAVLSALAVVDDDDPLDLLALAVRMGMGEGGAAGSGERSRRDDAEMR